MLRFTTLFTACILFISAQAQLAFEQVIPPAPAPQLQDVFDPYSETSSAFADVDGDNDQDLLIIGEKAAAQRFARLYTNDGTGQFTLVESTPFTPAKNGACAFADVDGDGDMDVLITGEIGTNQGVAALYTNDGLGNFTHVPGTPFAAVRNSAVAFADVDGDLDADLLITGRDATNQPAALLYTNNGSGTFTQAASAPFAGVQYGSVAFADADGDTDLDALIAGEDALNQPICQLYTNDGAGTFSLAVATPFDGVHKGAVAFNDVDGDTDMDVLITGEGAASQDIAALYTNNGSGNFSLSTAANFTGVRNSALAIADVDGDSDADVIITGLIPPNTIISTMYVNDGAGGFASDADSTFLGLTNGAISVADVDGDMDLDVFLTGLDTNVQRTTRLYINGGTAEFSPVLGTSFPPVIYGAVRFADVDGDTDADILITGQRYVSQSVTELYLNNGNGGYTLAANTPFEQVSTGDAAFADIDGDADQDLLITGLKLPAVNQASTNLYLNDGAGGYTLAANTPFDDVGSESRVVFADIDGDNDQDVLIGGTNASNQDVMQLFTNDGSGQFTLVSPAPFIVLEHPRIEFADVDGDTDLDVLIIGKDASNQRQAHLYTNDGSGNFTLQPGTPFIGVTEGGLAIADVDGDLDADVLITGDTVNSVAAPVTRLYLNDGAGNFSVASSTNLHQLFRSACAFADVDNDLDQDLLLAGDFANGIAVTELYLNDGAGDFTPVSELPFDSLEHGEIAFADIDGDTYQDVFLMGRNQVFRRVAKLYRNLPPPCASADTVAASACTSYVWAVNGQLYTVSGTYYDTLVNTAGCDSVITLHLTVLNSTSSTQSASACSSYIWPQNGEEYTVSGTYFDTLVNAAGCDSVISLTLAIQQVSDVSVTSAGATLTATLSGAAYQWLNCDSAFAQINGATSQSFTATANGSYAVELTENTCVDTSDCIAITNVGMAANASANSYRIYPNPATNQLHVAFTGAPVALQITIHNALGQRVATTAVQGNQPATIGIDGPPGLYFVEVTGPHQQHVIRLIKQ